MRRRGIKDEEMRNKWIALGGYVFVAVVSVIAALRMEENIIKVLLALSALMSLILAVSRIVSSKRMEEKIRKLEEEKQDKIVYASEDTCGSMVDELV